ncbi:MAG: cystathionine beta-synthase, partial [Chloroflexi bacterium]
MSDKTEHAMGEMRYDKSILELMGNTPLVRLNRVASDVPPLVLAKMEMFNPGGS